MNQNMNRDVKGRGSAKVILIAGRRSRMNDGVSEPSLRSLEGHKTWSPVIRLIIVSSVHSLAPFSYIYHDETVSASNSPGFFFPCG